LRSPIRGWQAKASIQSGSSIVAHTRSAVTLNPATLSIGRNATISSAHRRAPQHAIIAVNAVSASASFHDASVAFNAAIPRFAI
jgi:hypothetical protein